LAEAIGLEFEQICAEIEEEERVKLGCSVLLEISDEIKIEDSCEFVGPQIELDLGEGSSIFDGEPVVEVPDVVPTMVVEEEDSSVEVFISEKEMKGEQAEGTGTEPVPGVAMVREEVQVVGTGEPAPDVGRSGDEPDLMEIDAAVRTGEVHVPEAVVEGTRPEAVPDVAEERTGDAPVLEVFEAGTGSEPVPEEAVKGAGFFPDMG